MLGAWLASLAPGVVLVLVLVNRRKGRSGLPWTARLLFGWFLAAPAAALLAGFAFLVL